MVLNAVLAAAPVLAFAPESDQVLPAIYAGAAGVALLLVVLFARAGQPWAPDASPSPTQPC